ncbi:hypothetical protein RsoM2USA_175 [Ralstonia phage RsoM2USA]|nr:hypothetical protein RsoM2USA_175 [Ralstonia phage RsoM2USA]
MEKTMKDETIVVHFGVSPSGVPHVFKYEHVLCSNCTGKESYSFRILESEFEEKKKKLINDFNLERNVDKITSSNN